MRYHWETVRRSYALPFIVVGVAYYFLGSTQGTVEAFRMAQSIWHLTNYTVGHSHATMYGFITFIAWGAIYALLPRATGKRPNVVATGLHFWFATIGVTAYVTFLSIAGTEQGLDWAAGNPFIASIEAAAPYWLGRAVAGTLMFASHVIFAYNVYLMTLAPRREADRWQPAAPAVEA
jgi:cytochrome c oxidase cbb3-type subunit 1